jgi:hypothetical protein
MARQKILQRLAFARGVATHASHLREAKLGLRRELTTLGLCLSIQALGSCDVSQVIQLDLRCGDTGHAGLYAVGVELDHLQV